MRFGMIPNQRSVRAHQVSTNHLKFLYVSTKSINNIDNNDYTWVPHTKSKLNVQITQLCCYALLIITVKLETWKLGYMIDHSLTENQSDNNV